MKILSKLSSIETTFHTSSGPVVLPKNQPTEATKEQLDELMTQKLFKTYVDSKMIEVLGESQNDSVSTTSKQGFESDDPGVTPNTPARVRSTKTDS